MALYYATTKEDALTKKKYGFLEKGLNFTTDKSYAKQLVKSKKDPVICEIKMITNAFRKTKAKKPIYRNIVMFLTKTEIEEL